MPKYAGVAFKRAGKIYYFNPLDIPLEINDRVIVETSRGQEFGKVVTLPEEIEDEKIATELKNIIRKANNEDLELFYSYRLKERTAFQICKEKVKTHSLPMKLIDVEYTFDGTKIIFYFSAEGRIDFRELVKDLAQQLKKRIELHQIGVRDETKLIGGIGCCGKALCCCNYLREFNTVSIKMAKEQNLPLNPTKLSGICGRLMCCLKYENDVYEEVRKSLPKIGSWIEIENSAGKVIDYNILKKKVIAELPSKARVEVSGDNIKIADEKKVALILKELNTDEKGK